MIGGWGGAAETAVTWVLTSSYTVGSNPSDTLIHMGVFGYLKLSLTSQLQIFEEIYLRKKSSQKTLILLLEISRQCFPYMHWPPLQNIYFFFGGVIFIMIRRLQCNLKWLKPDVKHILNKLKSLGDLCNSKMAWGPHWFVTMFETLR